MLYRLLNLKHSTMKSKIHEFINTKNRAMSKTLKQISLLLAMLCCTYMVQAQCGVNAYWGYTINPNHVHVFTDSSTVTGGFQITNHYWSFGDGSTSNLTNPTHQYTTPGHFTVCEYVIGTQNGGTTTCIDTFCHDVDNCSGMVQAAISANVQGSTVVFTGTGTSNYPPLAFSWTFPGGTPSSSSTATTTVIYPNAGVQQACLTVTDANGCSATTCYNVTITNSLCGNLHASFSAGNTGAGLVQLQSTSTNVPNGSWYQWWMDGTALSPASAGLNVFTVQNISQGPHVFCLYIYAAQNSQYLCDSACQTVIVNNSTPCANINASFTSQSTSNYVVLSSTSTGTGSGTLYQWWMDGQAITNINPNTSYTLSNVSTGNHLFCLYVFSDANTFCDSTCQTVFVNTSQPCGGAQANFVYTLNGNSLSVNAGNNYPNGTNFQWWLDGVATGIAPTYMQYSYTGLSLGTHSVCLYIYGTSGTSFCDSICQTITVANCSVSAAFQTTVNGNVAVINQTANSWGIHSYWTFDDGGTGSDTSHAFYHVYPTNPNTVTYNVCHYVYMPGINCVDTVCQYIVIPGTATSCGTASFTSTQTSGHLVLTSNSTGTGISSQFIWYISNNNGTLVQTGTGTPFTTNALANGTYQVCLYLYSSNQTFCDSACQTITVSNSNACVGLSAQWTQTYNSNNSVTFTSSNNLSGTNYHWDFGDGHTSTLANPTHGYTNGGLYTVCLIVNVPGTTCADTSCHNIQANPVNNCTGTASISLTSNLNGSYTLTATYSGSSVAGYHWSNGAGTQTITVTSPNIYCVTVTTTTGCSATACQTVTGSCGTASFTASVVNSAIHANSTSTDTSSATHYYWNVWGANNNLIQTQSGVSSIFTSQTLPAGTYLVCLYLYGSNTQTFCDSACVNITITNANPCSGLSAAWTQTYLNTGGVQFASVTNTNTVTHHWTFGDGTTSTLANPAHYYTAAGLYTVCHIVNIPGSICADTSCHNIQANAANPCSSFNVNISQVTNANGAHGLQAVASGGGPTYYYYWSNGISTSTIYPTAAGAYCVTAYDNNQCTAAACDTITNNTGTCNALFSYAYVNCHTVQFSNASTGGYTNQIWHFGDGTSSSSANPVHTFPVGTWTVQLTVYSNGGACQASYYSVIHIQPCGISDTICGVVFNDVNGNGVQDNGEQGFNGGTIYASNQYSATVGANGHYTLVLPAGTYNIYYCAPSGYSFTIPVGTPNPNGGSISNCASYTITTSGGSHCGYDFGLQNNSVSICGTVYNDANNNHQQENTENGIANVHVTITASNGTIYHAYTDQNGHYCVTVPSGVYVIAISSTIGGIVTPQVITLTTVNGTNYYHNDFGIYVQPGACDLSIEITPHTTVTPGFPAWYDIQVCNVGASIANGTANLFFDPALSFNYSSPAQTSVNNSTHTVTWSLSNLLPGSCQNYWVNFDALTTVQVGQHVFMLANITSTGCNETNTINNVDTVHQDATASWDPNNKLVLPAGEGSEGKIKGDEELTYTVNFQNTGTADAVNVVVRDLIDTDLDLETFHMIGASHPYTMQFAGREAIWKFSSIMLPDSNANEPASHGHVTFAIKPYAGLAEGTQLTNTANIYFDYNAALPTNTTLNTIDYKLSVSELENGTATITLMPNPFKDFTTIKIDGENSTYVLRVFDILGQIIRNDISANNTFTIQREALAAGVYMYEVIKSNKVIGKGKMIAE